MNDPLTTPTAKDAVATNLPLAPDPSQRCKYRTGKCPHIRATKANGAPHALCQYHREKANKNQQAFDNKRRRSITEAQMPDSPAAHGLPPKKRRRSKLSKQLSPIAHGKLGVCPLTHAHHTFKPENSTADPVAYHSEEFTEDVFDFAVNEIDFLQCVLNTSPETIYGEIQLHNMMYPFAEQAGVGPHRTLDSPVVRRHEIGARGYDISPVLKTPLELSQAMPERFKTTPEGLPLPIYTKIESPSPYCLQDKATPFDGLAAHAPIKLEMDPPLDALTDTTFPERRAFALNFDVI